jgi:tetratricopeptide (TPR) repeat protein
MRTSANAEEARDLLVRGRNLYECGYPVRALRFVLRAAHLAPDNEEARHAVQTTRDEIHRLFGEVTRCEAMLAAHPTDAPTLLALADALTRLDRNAEAKATLERALDIDASNADALFDLGNLLNNSDRYEEALAVFDRLNVLRPTWAIPWSLKGMVLNNLLRPAEALPVLEHALTIDPGEVGAWTAKVWTLRTLGREAESQEAYQHERAARIASGVPAWMPRDVDPENAGDDDQGRHR